MIESDLASRAIVGDREYAGCVDVVLAADYERAVAELNEAHQKALAAIRALIAEARAEMAEARALLESVRDDSEPRTLTADSGAAGRVRGAGRPNPQQKGTTMSREIPDTERGAYDKYGVERLNDDAGKHAACRYFVLDPQHDWISRQALKCYAENCRSEYPELAADLLEWLAGIDIDNDSGKEEE
ncbi:MAG: hypothetical protein ACYCZR_05055 [Burkholderiales bacterium]